MMFTSAKSSGSSGSPASAGSNLAMLNGFALGVRRCFVVAILASAVSILFNFMIPQIIRFTVDFIIGSAPMNTSRLTAYILEAVGGRELLRANLIFCAFGIIICSLLSGVFNYCSRVNIAKGTEGFIKKFRDTLFSHIQRLPFQWHTENQSGDIIQRCTSDVETVREFVSAQLIEVLQTVILVLTALIMMFSMNINLAKVCTAFIPLIVLYSLFFYRRIAAQFLQADEAEGLLMGDIQENLTLVRVVRAFGREKYEKDLFEKRLNVFTQKWIDLGYTLGFYWGAGDLATAAQILAVVCVGAWLAATGRLTLGELLAFISYTYSISWPVRALGRTLSELSKAGVSITRLREILDVPLETAAPAAGELSGDIRRREILDVPSKTIAPAAGELSGDIRRYKTPDVPSKTIAPAAAELGGDIRRRETLDVPAKTIVPAVGELSGDISRHETLDVLSKTIVPAAELSGDISFEHVSFKYGDATVLADLSFRIPQGATFGILGATGAGKSTIAYLLSRLYDLGEEGGRICINGVDIRDLNRFQLRSSIGLVLQEPFLFSKTVRENIEIAAPYADLALTRQNARIAAVDSNIVEFKDGYDTMVGERGVTLSGGQKQRIAIARTLMMNCPIMIFDDSLSSVDMETEERIRLALLEHTRGKTIILISHRISTLMQAEKIMVLEKGRVAQLGSHAELVTQDGLYRRVYKMQSDAALLKGAEEGGDHLD